VAVALRVGNLSWEVGSGPFLTSFFSTIACILEAQGLGTRFGGLRMLYDGELPASQADRVRSELEVVRAELRRSPPDQVVWDREDLDALPLGARTSAPRSRIYPTTS